MSASNPNSWEPYGSSQQSPALGWRTPATRPAQTLSERWKNAQAKALKPPFPRPAPSTTPPNPAPKGKTLDLAAFQRAEQEHRLLTRCESIRSEVREVAESVKQLTKSLENSRDLGDEADNALRDETAAIHVTIAKLNQRFDGCRYVTEQQVKDILRDFVNGQTDVIQATNAALDRIEAECKSISAGVDCLNKGLCERVSKRVADDVGNMINRGVIPVVENRVEQVVAPILEHVEGVLGGFMERLETRFDRIEDIVSTSTTSPDRGVFQNGFDHARREYHEERVREGYNAHELLDTGDRALSSERGDYDIGDCNTRKARDFDVSVRKGPISQERSREQGPIWARLRIRPAVKADVIDLAKSDDSAAETNLFEDGDCRERGSAAKDENVVVREDSWLPGEGFVRADGGQSPYFTRSAKKQRC